MEDLELEDINFEDQLANILNGEEDPIDEPEPEPKPEVKPEPEIAEDLPIKIKYKGEEIEVPLSELKNGYQRQADYTHKTQELSQERQEVTKQKQQWDEYISSIPVLANVAQQNTQQAQEALYSEDMMKLAQNDPAEYVAKKAELERVIMSNQQSLEQMAGHWDAHQNELNSTIQSFKAKEFEQTNDQFTKEYGEDWTSGKIYKELIDYGQKIGFQKADIDSLSNYNIINTLHKAKLYDDLVNNKSLVQKQVEKIPPKVTKIQNDGDLVEEDFKTRRNKAINKMHNGDDSDFIDLLAAMI